MREVDLQLARTLLDYDPETGIFRWKAKPNRRITVGAVAGSKHVNGYRVLRIDRMNVLAHRLALAMVNGEWPADIVDHKNGIRTDNRICNLRVANKSINALNAHAKPRSSTGYRGVSYDRRRGIFVAKLDRKWLGYFSNAEEASSVYEAAKSAYLQEVTQC